MPKKCENGSLLLRLGLPSTLIRHETEPFEKSLQAGGIWKHQLSTLTFLFPHRLSCFCFSFGMYYTQVLQHF